jgi:cyclophilin family peptidyl-prolyl cis-trans isomerase
MACAALMLASCGGGLQAVTGVTIPNLRYTGSLGVINVSLVGRALTASGMRVYANGTLCSNDNSTSETSRSASCVITVPDDLKVEIRVTNINGDENHRSDFYAPMPQVSFQTSMGDVVMELNPTKAPITVKNFLSYVNQSPSFYQSTIFHRVIAGFVVQGGGFTSGMVAKTGQSAAIALESNNGLKNERGTVAMARSTDPNSATSQFYVNVVNNTSLNYVSDSSPGYAVFGTVISGMDVIDNIANQATTTVNGNNDVPVTDITVTSASQTK